MLLKKKINMKDERKLNWKMREIFRYIKNNPMETI